MPKYITLDTASDGVMFTLIQIHILYCETTSSTAGDIFLTNGGSHKMTVTGTGLTSGFSANVNAALVTAAENILD